MFPFKVALNASTLFPYKLDVLEQIKIAAEAGYQGIELWVRDIEAYLQNGGTTGDIKNHLDEAGIELVNAIAFFKWSDKDETTRRQGLEQAEREMKMLVEMGCKAVAAPPFGDVESVSLDEMAENFSELSDLGRKIGIEPYLEFWGKAKNLSKLSEAAYVAIESGVPEAKILLDPFHMYTGGSNVNGLHYLDGKTIGIVHVNDYPAEPNQETIADRDRVFPGEGIAPSKELTKLLKESNYTGYLSLELFIEDFGDKTPLEVATYGLEKIKMTYK